jgi:hypothetical protein
MLHVQSPCTSCNFEEKIVSELRNRPILLTNHTSAQPMVQFSSKEYGNSVDIGKVLQNVESSFRFVVIYA